MQETERADGAFRDLERREPEVILEALLAGQRRALDAVSEARIAIAQAVEEAARRLGTDGRLIYCGAGTSGRIGLLDAVELGPTFDWPDERRVVLLAGGETSLWRAREGAEDDGAAGREAIEAIGPRPSDVVLGLAASGRTPFTIAAIETAREAGALTLGFANNPGAPLLSASEHPILLRTGPEVLAGSTRLAAGTAQKAALNLFSTLLMIRFGKVFRGRMVEMRPTNAKLKQRAHRIVQDVVGCSPDEAARALEAAGGSIREAILSLEAAR
ncbi:N-acetylmuramic acid 6-phosphate etherase [Aureimonas sp. Leaf324]|uniref:N-acetylmuramic acid 6-phosphate etherase n=1 Tax=Aureimonas sp. Leaf324 TaxID=1736336 RepID=UPI000A5A5548|nr:N-acetylmuramic acid 6-phosphate etherase [Aureimonas sp. Leaf324]